MEETELFGRKAIRLISDGLDAWVVPELGGRLLRLKTCDDPIDILRTPVDWDEYSANPNLYGIPILCPPNRIADGRFRFDGRTYTLTINEPLRNNHIHGFAQDKPWQLVSYDAIGDVARVDIEWRAQDFPDVQAQFPHALSLRLRYSLQGNELQQEVLAKNEGAEPVPFGIGFHTTFPVPFCKTSDAADCTLAITLDRRFALNERMLPTGRLETPVDRDEWRQGKALSGLVLDDVFTSVVPDGQRHTAVLRDVAGGITVTYACADPVCNWVLYTRDGHSGFISVEPYTWVTNAPNLDLPAEVTGMRAIAPGDTQRVQSAITVDRVAPALTAGVD